MGTDHKGYSSRYESYSLTPTKYDPNNLLTGIIRILRLKNDAALSRALDVAPPVISKIRHGKLPIGASMLIRMQEISYLSIRELRELMGDRRNKFRIGDRPAGSTDRKENTPEK